MARPGSKKAKKPDPRIAHEWDVSKYPYVIHKPAPADPVYRTSFKEAINWLRSDVNGLKARFTDLDAEVVESCDLILQQIEMLPGDGGQIDMIAVPYNDIRYRAELVRREQV